jgi:hypothetical protein
MPVKTRLVWSALVLVATVWRQVDIVEGVCDLNYGSCDGGERGNSSSPAITRLASTSQEILVLLVPLEVCVGLFDQRSGQLHMLRTQATVLIN